jgi:hypothetical protein
MGGEVFPLILKAIGPVHSVNSDYNNWKGRSNRETVEGITLTITATFQIPRVPLQ